MRRMFADYRLRGIDASVPLFLFYRNMIPHLIYCIWMYLLCTNP